MLLVLKCLVALSFVYAVIGASAMLILSIVQRTMFPVAPLWIHAGNILAELYAIYCVIRAFGKVV